MGNETLRTELCSMLIFTVQTGGSWELIFLHDMRACERTLCHVFGAQRSAAHVRRPIVLNFCVIRL